MFFPLHGPACMGHMCLNEHGEQLRKEGDQGRSSVRCGEGIEFRQKYTCLFLFFSILFSIFLFYSFLFSFSCVRVSPVSQIELGLELQAALFPHSEGISTLTQHHLPLLLLPATQGFLSSPCDLPLFLTHPMSSQSRCDCLCFRTVCLKTKTKYFQCNMQDAKTQSEMNYCNPQHMAGGRVGCGGHGYFSDPPCHRKTRVSCSRAGHAQVFLEPRSQFSLTT